MNGLVHLHRLSGEDMAPGCIMERWKVQGDSVMLETLCPPILYGNGTSWFEEHNNEEVLTLSQSSPHLSPIKHLGCVGQTSPIHAGPTLQLTGLKQYANAAWCQLPKLAFGGLLNIHISTGQGCFGGKGGLLYIGKWSNCYGWSMYVTMLELKTAFFLMVVWGNNWGCK